MKNILISISLFLLSCSNFSGQRIVSVNDSNNVVPILFEVWQGQKISFLEKKIGSAAVIEIKENMKIYSYNDSAIEKLTLLTVKANKDGDILSMYYLLSDDNSKIKKDWVLKTLSNYEWREIKLPITNHHAVVQKVVLLNDEKKISVGFQEGYKNNQIEFIYFDIDEENYKSEKLFFWE